MTPIMIVQDTISVWVYRREWSAWNLKVMLLGSVFGVAAAGLGAATLSDAQVRLVVSAIGVVFVLYNWLARVPTVARTPMPQAACSGGAGGHLDHRAGGRAAVLFTSCRRSSTS